MSRGEGLEQDEFGMLMRVVAEFPKTFVCSPESFRSQKSLVGLLIRMQFRTRAAGDLDPYFQPPPNAL